MSKVVQGDEGRWEERELLFLNVLRKFCGFGLFSQQKILILLKKITYLCEFYWSLFTYHILWTYYLFLIVANACHFKSHVLIKTLLVGERNENNHARVHEKSSYLLVCVDRKFLPSPRPKLFYWYCFNFKCSMHNQKWQNIKFHYKFENFREKWHFVVLRSQLSTLWSKYVTF